MSVSFQDAMSAYLTMVAGGRIDGVTSAEPSIITPEQTQSPYFAARSRRRVQPA